MSDNSLKTGVEQPQPRQSTPDQVIAEFLQDETPFRPINPDLRVTRPRQQPSHVSLSVAESLALIEEDS